jgi:hypothetical protein
MTSKKLKAEKKLSYGTKILGSKLSEAVIALTTFLVQLPR